MISAGLKLFASRLGRNLTAQAYSQVATLGIQLATIPLLIHAWGVSHYGVWLTLTAIPTYLAFSDFGFTFIAKNDMAARVARGDRSGALETYHSVQLLLLWICPAIFVVAAGAALLTPIGSLLHLGGVSERDAKLVICLQTFGILMLQLFYLLCASVRAIGRPATETGFAANSRVLEAVCLVGAASLGGGLVAAATAGLMARLAMTFGLAIWTHRAAPWLPLGLRGASRQRLKELVSPSMSYMMVPIANAVLIQGPVVVLGSIATPEMVALFATTRTVARLGMSGANMLSNGFVAEYNYAWGTQDSARFTRLLRMQGTLLLLGVAAYVAVMASLGGFGVSLLSHHRMTPYPALIAALACGVTFEMLWTSVYAPLTATVSHRSTSVAFAVASLGLFAVAPFKPSIVALALAISAVHAGTFVFSLTRLKELLKRFEPRRAAPTSGQEASARITVVGTHPLAQQRSMKLYADWIVAACAPLGSVELVTAPAVFLNRWTRATPVAKWLHYVDQYILLQIALMWRQFRRDLILVADHSNMPSTFLVRRCPLVAMVHDTIAMRQGLGRIPNHPAAGLTGRTLQRLTIASLRRCDALLANPAPVSDELRELGVGAPVVAVGCPFDESRLQTSAANRLPPELTQGRYLLNVGSDTVRKRKPELLKLWRAVEQRDPELWLVLAGRTNRSTAELAETLGLRRVLILEDVDDAQLGRLYAHSAGVVVASEFEGFCIPVLEGIALHKRIFTPTDVEFFPSVFGECAEPCLDVLGGKCDRLLAALQRAQPHGYEAQRAKLLCEYNSETHAKRTRKVAGDVISRQPIYAPPVQAKCA